MADGMGWLTVRRYERLTVWAAGSGALGVRTGGFDGTAGGGTGFPDGTGGL